MHDGIELRDIPRILWERASAGHATDMVNWQDTLYIMFEQKGFIMTEKGIDWVPHKYHLICGFIKDGALQRKTMEVDAASKEDMEHCFCVRVRELISWAEGLMRKAVEDHLYRISGDDAP